MSFETRCPQCVFLSRHLGRLTACLLHVGPPVATHAPAADAEPAPVAQDYDEPYEFGRPRPSVDRPGPFTFREYMRLLLLRGRLHAERDAALAAS